MSLVTIKSVPICETGVEYPLSTGPATFTEQDLADAATLANEDPTYRTPRLKLGHAEGGWQAGEPAFGQFSNLHVSVDGQTLMADIVNVPDWLATILPSAYPSRSIEGMQGYKSNAGKTYGLAIDAVALLGVEMPGVSSLDDLEAILTDPEVTVTEEGMFQIAAAARRMRAQVDVDFVRRQFYEQVATGDRYWWWIRSVRIDPNEMIAEDEETGDLYRIPFATSENAVTFEEAVKVYEKFEDAPADEQEPVAAASWNSAAQSRPTTRGGRMTPKELRAAIGLPESATDDEVKDRLKTLQAEAPAPTTVPPTDAVEDEEDEDQEGADEVMEEPPEGTPPASEAPPPTTATVDAAAFRQLQEDARLGREAREQQITARRRGKVTAAIEAGKIPPARRGHYESLMTADEEGTTTMLASLEEGVIPIEARGKTTVTEEGVAASASDYPLSWLSNAERERVLAERAQEVAS